MTTSSIQPVTSTINVIVTPSAPLAAASASTSAQPTSGSGVGAIVGGIGAGIVGCAAVGFIIAYFLRRTRKRDIDGTFDANNFRRSAVILPDPPTHEDTVARGYNPPPSSGMEQQHLPVPASAWGYGGSHYEQNAAGADFQNYYPNQVVPGQIVSPTSPPRTTQGQLFINPHAAYPGPQSVFSPISPLQSPYEQSISSPVLTRQASNGFAIAPYPTLTRQPTTKSSQIPADDYVDLDRSSVSPFQAVQYAEISRKLNSQPPSGLSSPAQLYATQQKDLPPPPPARSSPEIPASVASYSVSPFADPTHTAPGSPPSSPRFPVTPVMTEPSTPVTPSMLNVQTLHIPAHSTDTVSQVELQFPVPPSPAISYSSRYRVDSLPPTLPEIQVQNRSSVSSFMKNSPLGSGFPSGVSDVGEMGLQTRLENKYVNSPLASSFGIPSPLAAFEDQLAKAQEKAVKATSASSPLAAPVTRDSTPAPAPSSSATERSKDSDGKRPNTIYDPEDAYGGI